MADSTLNAIRIKVRRLTRSMTTSQLTDAQIDEYVNTFVLYDFPEHLRLFALRTTFTFYTNPYQDVYPTDEISFAGATSNPLFNFKNRYVTVHPPLYIAGFQSFYSQSREQFFNIYPKVNSISSIGTAGDGVTTSFTGVVNTQQAVVPPNTIQQISLLQNEVLFSSVDANGSGLALVDVPLVNPTTGNNSVFGNLYIPGQEPTTPPVYPADLNLINNVNYSTGVFTITFPTAPASGQPINSQTVLQQLSLPQAMVYYDNTFIVRPVPDQPYRVQFEAYIRPTELITLNQTPELQEWWQYIAYGAAKKVFEDRMDLDSVQLIMPEFKKQETLVLRRTIVQYTNDRAATIYTEQTSSAGAYGPGWWQGGGSF